MHFLFSTFSAKYVLASSVKDFRYKPNKRNNY